MKFVGIDPGVTGAIALLPDETIWDTPVILINGKRSYQPVAMARIIQEILDGAGDEEVMVALERQQAFPRQGSVSTGSIMRGYGLWEGILAAVGVAYSCPRPQEWQRAIGRAAGKDKGASVQRAQQLFPRFTARWKKNDHGKSDALLLAAYAQRGFTKPTEV